LIFLVGLVGLLLLPNRLALAKFCAYIAFYPFILLFWQIPKLVVRLGSWSLALGLANALISYFYSFRYRTISLATYIICFTTVVVSNQPSLLIISSSMLMFTLICSYYGLLLGWKHIAGSF
jgi:hypothetical protein